MAFPVGNRQTINKYCFAPGFPLIALRAAKTTDSKTDLGELIREVDELAVFNEEAHHIHNPKMAWFKSIQDIHHRMLQRDGRLPALNDQTPREAASTEEGRDLLESLLLYYESHEDEPYDNLMRPDVAALQRELGIRGQDESRGGKKGRPAAS